LRPIVTSDKSILCKKCKIVPSGVPLWITACARQNGGRNLRLDAKRRAVRAAWLIAFHSCIQGIFEETSIWLLWSRFTIAMATFGSMAN
jgi:hypothetical protein